MNVNPPNLFKNLTTDCKPIATKSRRFSATDSKFIKSEVDRLYTEGIIEESTSPWRSQILITSSENHKKRMVIDYSRTINQFTELDAYPIPYVDDMITEIVSYSHYSMLDLKSAYHQIPIAPEDRDFISFEADGRLYRFTRMPFGITNGVAGMQRMIEQIIEKENLNDIFPYVDNITICGNSEKEHNLNLQKFRTAAKTSLLMKTKVLFVLHPYHCWVM